MKERRARPHGAGFSRATNHTAEQVLMTTSQPTSMLSKPVGDKPVPAGTLGYFQARNRSRLYEAVIREFVNSGLSQATLARRMRKRPEQINRLLGAPGNWELDTVSDLLFAISGGEPIYGVQYPLEEPGAGVILIDAGALSADGGPGVRLSTPPTA